MDARGIRELVVKSLMFKTDALDRVYSPRTWPTMPDQYPVVLVQTPLDEKHSLGPNVPQFTTVTTVRITGRLQEFDSEYGNDGAERAEEVLEKMRRDVERAVINSYDLTREIQQFLRVRSTIELDASGEGHFAQLLMEIDAEYYQGPEDFYLVETSPLDGIDTTIIMPDGTPQPVVKSNLE